MPPKKTANKSGKGGGGTKGGGGRGGPGPSRPSTGGGRNQSNAGGGSTNRGSQSRRMRRNTPPTHNDPRLAIPRTSVLEVHPRERIGQAYIPKRWQRSDLEPPGLPDDWKSDPDTIDALDALNILQTTRDEPIPAETLDVCFGYLHANFPEVVRRKTQVVLAGNAAYFTGSSQAFRTHLAREFAHGVPNQFRGLYTRMYHFWPINMKRNGVPHWITAVVVTEKGVEPEKKGKEREGAEEQDEEEEEEEDENEDNENENDSDNESEDDGNDGETDGSLLRNPRVRAVPKPRYMRIRNIAVIDPDRSMARRAQNERTVFNRLVAIYNQMGIASPAGDGAMQNQNVWVPPRNWQMTQGNPQIERWSGGLHCFWLIEKFLHRTLDGFSRNHIYPRNFWAPAPGYFNPDFVRSQMIGYAAQTVMKLTAYTTRVAIEPILNMEIQRSDGGRVVVLSNLQPDGDDAVLWPPGDVDETGEPREWPGRYAARDSGGSDYSDMDVPEYPRDGPDDSQADSDVSDSVQEPIMSQTTSSDNESNGGPSNSKGNTPSGNKGKAPAKDKGKGPATNKGKSPATNKGKSPATTKRKGPTANKDKGPTNDKGKNPVKRGKRGRPAKKDNPDDVQEATTSLRRARKSFKESPLKKQDIEEEQDEEEEEQHEEEEQYEDDDEVEEERQGLSPISERTEVSFRSTSPPMSNSEDEEEDGEDGEDEEDEDDEEDEGPEGPDGPDGGDDNDENGDGNEEAPDGDGNDDGELFETQNYVSDVNSEDESADEDDYNPGPSSKAVEHEDVSTSEPLNGGDSDDSDSDWHPPAPQPPKVPTRDQKRKRATTEEDGSNKKPKTPNDATKEKINHQRRVRAFQDQRARLKAAQRERARKIAEARRAQSAAELAAPQAQTPGRKTPSAQYPTPEASSAAKPTAPAATPGDKPMPRWKPRSSQQLTHDDESEPDNSDLDVPSHPRMRMRRRPAVV